MTHLFEKPRVSTKRRMRCKKFVKLCACGWRGTSYRVYDDYPWLRDPSPILIYGNCQLPPLSISRFIGHFIHLFIFILFFCRLSFLPRSIFVSFVFMDWTLLNIDTIANYHGHYELHRDKISVICPLFPPTFENDKYRCSSLDPRMHVCHFGCLVVWLI